MALFKKKPVSKSYYRNTKAYKRAHRKNYHIPRKILTLLYAAIIINIVFLAICCIIAIGTSILSDASVPDLLTGMIIVGLITAVGFILLHTFLSWLFLKTGHITKQEE